MGNIGTKLIVLVVLICSVAIAFTIYQKSQNPDLMFDDDFVLEMFEKNKTLTSELQETSTSMIVLQENLDNVQQDLLAAVSEKKLHSENLSICENQKNSVLALLNEQQDRLDDVGSVTQLNRECSQNMKKMPLLKADADAFKQQLETSRVENNKLLADLESVRRSEQELAKNYRVLQKKMDLIYSESLRIREDLFKPIYLKDVFVTPKFCNKVSSANEVCLDSVLVLPKFSKIPYTKVIIKLLDPDQNVVGSTLYNQQENKIARFEMTRNKEFSAGNFTVVVEADNQVLNFNQYIGEKPQQTNRN